MKQRISAIYRKLDERQKMHISGHVCVYGSTVFTGLSWEQEPKNKCHLFWAESKMENECVCVYVEMKIEWITIFENNSGTGVCMSFEIVGWYFWINRIYIQGIAGERNASYLVKATGFWWNCGKCYWKVSILLSFNFFFFFAPAAAAAAIMVCCYSFLFIAWKYAPFKCFYFEYGCTNSLK